MRPARSCGLLSTGQNVPLERGPYIGAVAAKFASLRDLGETLQFVRQNEPYNFARPFNDTFVC